MKRNSSSVPLKKNLLKEKGDCMSINPANPLIVQGDHTILLEVHNPLFETVRHQLSRFAELEKSPEYIHTYRISPLSLWNAAAAGVTCAQIKDFFETYSKYPLPEHVLFEIQEQMEKYGILKLIKEGEQLILACSHPSLLTELYENKEVRSLVKKRTVQGFVLPPEARGQIKHVLIKLGYPVEDLAGYTPGSPYSLSLRPKTRAGSSLQLRYYQKEAIDAFHAGGSSRGGSGVVVLPCGAGKTLTGMGIMDKLQTETLILVTNGTALRQWKAEILDKTTIPEEEIGEYSGEKKEIRPITISTYQILTYRAKKGEPFTHFQLFHEKGWGLIIYDEVHTLPAPLFRITSAIQSKRRLGLTATLIREDGLEDDVFSLIGPKKYEVPWKQLERENWIATARCVEVRIPMADDVRMEYAVSNNRKKFRVAAENPQKLKVVTDLLEKHKQDQILIIGQYIQQLKDLASAFNLPILTGSTPNKKRQEVYEAFQQGVIKTLVVSKIANFAVDLPDATVAIQVSGTFGSRQEEAQRLGRILRPKKGNNQAFFYSLVSKESKEQVFATNRQMFLTEQGYTYTIWSL